MAARPKATRTEASGETDLPAAAPTQAPTQAPAAGPRGERRQSDHRRAELVAATIKVIAQHGLADVTLAKVAGLAGLTAGMVNFHFASKQALLKEALRELADEYQREIEQAVAGAGGDPADILSAMIAINFSEQVSSTEKVAATYAFWSETQAREEYQTLCGTGDRIHYELILDQCVKLIERDNLAFDADSVAQGLDGLIDSKWQQILLEGAGFDRQAAIETCHRYLRNFFPDVFTLPQAQKSPARGAVDARRKSAHPRADTAVNGLQPTLPAWTYASQSFAAKERTEIHLKAWHPVCHTSELAEPGSFATIDALGERAFVIRGEDGTVRGFHNVCPHRAHAVVSGTGRCEGLVRCPYHAWGFDFEGNLKAIAAKKAFPPFDSGAFGLKPLPCDVFMGFVFVRFAGDAGDEPGIADRLAAYNDELAPHRFEDMVATGPLYEEVVAADWKNIWDNFLEDYHFPTGHPGLFGLMNMDYDRDADDATRTARLSHALRKEPKGGWSNRAYARLLPDDEHLPKNGRRRWSYIYLYPAMAFDFYPDGMDYMHVIPDGPGRARIRFREYGLPGASRETRACRWLRKRILMDVHREDVALVSEVQKGLASGGYSTGLLGEKEHAVAALQRWVRDDLPLAQRNEKPTGF